MTMKTGLPSSPCVLFDRMWDQVEVARQDSDTSFFMNLLFFGEMLVKLCAAGLVAAVPDERDRHRYRQIHRLVRADGIGEWSDAIDDVLLGPASQSLLPGARSEQKELVQNCISDTWQHESVRLIAICVKEIDSGSEGIPTKVAARRWFALFAQLRNKTRGHGVPQGSVCGRVAPALMKSLRLITENHVLFKRPWVYLHRNLSGKYRVTSLADGGEPFEYLKSTTSAHFEDGVYIYFDEPRRIELIVSDPESSDFFFPNGGFNGKTFEAISYFTANRMRIDASPYLAPATELPASQTQGLGTLALQGKSFGNLPPVESGYVHRTALESELFSILTDDRHPVITLSGTGGIGKTSLTLKVLQRIAEGGKFGAILWFSARDIDLLVVGPKIVQPRVLTEGEIANEFVSLMEPKEANSPGFKSTEYLSNSLRISPTGDPFLFVFDNFETVRNPSELFAWIDTYVRLPNKVLITTRVRDFKGDYPVEVLGMAESECQKLIEETVLKLRIKHLVSEKYRQELIRESDGHPYVIKILLGEVAKAGSAVKVERIVSGRGEILDALFERTFTGLSPAAKQVFLTLCNWRSIVPLIAMEAVMLRPGRERFAVDAAVDELIRSSLVETVESRSRDLFLSVPLVAAVFGKQKFSVSPLKTAIEANTEILRLLGAAQKTDIERGVGPRISNMFAHIAVKVSKDKTLFEEYLPIMEFISQKYSAAWLLLARLHEESNLEGSLEKAKESILRYLEIVPKSEEQLPVWKRLAQLCFRTDDWTGEIHALVEMCEIPSTPFAEISSAANKLNGLLYHHQFLEMGEKAILVQRLADLMASKIQEGDATDRSRLAWLYLHLRNEPQAAIHAKEGLRQDPQNEYCQKIQARLGI